MFQPAPAAPPHAPPRIGVVSLGCPKALVDSERILARLRAEGYRLSGDADGADLVIVNTCGFLDSAKAESLEAIGEALTENGKVIVTGCLGVEEARIRAAHPGVLAVTGPHQYAAVLAAVRAHAPIAHNPYTSLTPAPAIDETAVKLTPRHYAYLKISEGCNNSCSFCIIPAIRGRLVSRPIDGVLREAERLAHAGVRELLIISQDTSAYGADLKYAPRDWRGRPRQTRLYDLCEGLGGLSDELGIWARLHYVYPYPHVDEILPLMAAGKILPYLDIPFQHASPAILRAMRRPAAQEKTLARIARWREAVPDLTIRSTFIVGFPGERDEDFDLLLDWLEEARIDRAGCFKYEPVAGAPANDLAPPVEDELVDIRYQRFHEAQAVISEARLRAKIGRTLDVLIDEAAGDDGIAIGRSQGDAPEIDGVIRLRGAPDAAPGDILRVEIDNSDTHDLEGRAIGASADRRRR